MLRRVPLRPSRAAAWLGFACSLAPLTLARATRADEHGAAATRETSAEGAGAALGAPPERVHVT
jgi:hypothetical protein